MSNINCVFNLGSSRSNLTLTAQIVDVSGVDYGGPITDVVELGGGAYQCLASVDDGFIGAAELLQGTTILGVLDISCANTLQMAYTVVSGINDDYQQRDSAVILPTGTDPGSIYLSNGYVKTRQNYAV